MFLLFLLIWIVLSGAITWEILIIGVLISAAMYFFALRFTGLTFLEDLKAVTKLPLLVKFTAELIIEVIKANIGALKLICSCKYEPEPLLVHFKTDLRSPITRVLLADSITLTPGTITVSLTGDEYLVHCLDKDMAEGLGEGSLAETLARLEETKND